MSVSMVRLPGAAEVADIVDALTGDDQPMGSPCGYVLYAEVRPELAQTLVGVAEEMRRRRLDPPLMLVGVDHNRHALQTVVDAWDTTLLVDPGNEHLIERLQRFLPALFDNWHSLGAVGSAMLYRVDVDGIHSRSEMHAGGIERELCMRKTPVLHQLANVDYPDFYTVAAGGDYTSLAFEALSRQAAVVDVQGANQSDIIVGGFVFDDVDTTIDERLAGLREARSPVGETAGDNGRTNPENGEDGHSTQIPPRRSVQVRQVNPGP